MVGSGATGSWAAKKLTQAGFNVALLEAGSKTSQDDFCEATQPNIALENILQDRSIQAYCYACRGAHYNWFVSDIDNPYTQIRPYHWIRMRILGGRTLAWARHSYRMSNLDFQAGSRDGYGEDWPICYEDLVPYYEEVERHLGISGFPEHFQSLPDSIFSHRADLAESGQIFRASAMKSFGRIVTPPRYTLAGQDHRVDALRLNDTDMRDYSTPWSPLRDAARTGHLTLFIDAIARQVLTRNGRATEVLYVDRKTGNFLEIAGKLIILCASTLESTRIMLNSHLCDPNGALGHYLMDHIYQGGASGTMYLNCPEGSTDEFCVPRFRNLAQSSTNRFIRGYGLQGTRSPSCSTRKFFTNPSKGKPYCINLNLWGECLPEKTNYVDIDRDRVDRWGIPVLRINSTWSENELKLWQDGRVESAQMLEAAGAENIRLTGRVSIPGSCVHELGTARMGNNPKTSVVNRYCQVHDIPNLFITDGACWVTSGWQNPTLTMMAITVRACDYIIREYRKSFY